MKRLLYRIIASSMIKWFLRHYNLYNIKLFLPNRTIFRVFFFIPIYLFVIQHRSEFYVFIIY